MTPLDEMRADFEAKHTPEYGVEWNDKHQRYIPNFPLNANEGVRDCILTEVAMQNSRWQGYQSAMEDRGEAVAVAHAVDIDCTCGANAAPNPAPACDENPIFNDIEVAVYKVSEPDQWNAAIEAAAKKVLVGWPLVNGAKVIAALKGIRNDILALRKGA